MQRSFAYHYEAVDNVDLVFRTCICPSTQCTTERILTFRLMNWKKQTRQANRIHNLVTLERNCCMKLVKNASRYK